MKSLFIITCFAVFSVFAETSTNAIPNQTARRQRTFEERTGGLFEKPGTQKGTIVFFSDQKQVPLDELNAVIPALSQDVRFKYIVTDDKTVKGNVMIKIIDDPDKQTLLVAPFDAWAVVNVAKLSKGLSSEAAKKKFLPSRTRKVMMKAFAYASGSGASQFPGNMFAAKTIEELDLMEERFPMDVVSGITAFLASRNVTPSKLCTYRRAVNEGWAPAPTNDIQRAIWDKIHSIPTKPIKITYDKDKQKPVVK